MIYLLDKPQNIEVFVIMLTMLFAGILTGILAGQAVDNAEAKF